MRRQVGLIFGGLLAIILVAAPWAYGWYKSSHLRNFRTVRPGVLYRSGQLSLDGLKRVLHDYGIRTVVTLRDTDNPARLPPDHAEETFCRSQGIRHVRITPRPWSSVDGSEAPGMRNIQEFLAVVDDPANHPVLVHCFAGCHRTGVACAVFRMEYDGWTVDQAIAEMRRLGYVNIDREPDVRGFLLNYRPRRN